MVHRGQQCDRLERGWERGRSRPKEQGGRGLLAGSLGKWVCEGCRRKVNENEQRKAPHPIPSPKQLTWDAGGFLADPLQIPTPSRKLPAVSWPWDSKQLTPCLMMPGSTSFTGILKEKTAVRLVLCPPGLTHAYPEGGPSQLLGHLSLCGRQVQLAGACKGAGIPLRT